MPFFASNMKNSRNAERNVVQKEPGSVPPDVDLAYAAGLFDGEGSVGVSLRKQSGRSVTVTPSIKACIAMVDEDSIRWLSDKFGGHVDTTNKSKTGRTIFRWTLHCRKAADFFEMILPYLKLKKERCEVAIQLARRTSSRGAKAGMAGNEPLPDSEITERTRLALIIREANQRSNPKIASYAKWGVV